MTKPTFEEKLKAVDEAISIYKDKLSDDSYATGMAAKDEIVKGKKTLSELKAYNMGYGRGMMAGNGFLESTVDVYNSFDKVYKNNKVANLIERLMEAMDNAGFIFFLVEKEIIQREIKQEELLDKTLN